MTPRRRTIRMTYWLIIACALALAACGGGGGGGGGGGTTTYAIGGSVSGLVGSGLVLRLNGGADLAVVGNGAFAFSTVLADGAVYDVTVLTQPTSPSQTCNVTNGSGTVSGANVTNAAVSCVTSATGPLDNWVTNGSVGAIALSADGTTVYIGGDFTRVGPRTGSFVPFDASSGIPAGTYPKVDGWVSVAVPDGAGGWYIGGNFTLVGTAPRNNLARIRADGSVDPDWNPNANNYVRTLAASGSTVYAGGVFTSIGGQSRYFVAALDATTGLANSWNANANGDVYALAVSGSTLYAGGYFTSIGGQARNNLAALDAVTGLATIWNPNVNNTVRTLVVSGSTVYAGGDFTTAGGQARNSLAALDTTTGLATAWNPNASGVAFPRVNALAVSGSTVYVGGDFTTVGGQTRYRLAALDAGTGLATAWNPYPSSPVYTISVSGSTVYVGGMFVAIGGQARNNLAALDAATGLATAWNPDVNNTVQTIAVSGSTIFAGGVFTSAGGQVRNRIAALDAATGLPAAWNPNASGGSSNTMVEALAVSGSTIYAGGDFSFIGGQGRNRIAALDAATGLATAWNPNADNIVRTLALSGSTVYAGGKFTSIGGQPRNRIAALDATTGIATAWNPNANGSADSTVYTLAVSGSTVYAGGYFTSIGGQARNNLAALDAATGLATAAWNPDVNGSAYSSVSALAVLGSRVYVGGDFTTVGGQVRNRIAALDATTGLATAWNPNAWGTYTYLGAYRAVATLAVFGPAVYAGGGFTSIDGEVRSGIAFLPASQ